MSRFLFSTLGSLGDVHPYIAVARVLIAQGHGAIITASEEHREVIQCAGVEFCAMCPAMAQKEDYQAAVAQLFDVRRGPELLVRRFVMPHLRTAYKNLLAASRRADVLVSHPLAMALPLVAEKLGIPRVATVLSPLLFVSAYDPPVIPEAVWLHKLRFCGPGLYRFLFKLAKHKIRSWERPLRGLRKEIGLAPLRQSAMLEGHYSALLNLAMFDPQLAQPQPDWPANTLVCGSAIFDGAPPESAVIEDLENFLAAGEAPVVFALGSSAVWIAGDFWDKAVAATLKLGLRAILLTGPHVPEGLPVTVRAYSYLPYSMVFPRASIVVHQAGIGTLSHALRAGRPQLIVPVAFDQPDNARRACSLGLARTVPFRKVTAHLLAAEISLLLGSAKYSDAARSVAARLSHTDGATSAAQAIAGAQDPPPHPP
ncbi:MAG: glycosyltransferase [Deltaproteobacteria bacterium]|nr:glycosyltransferase [Deltaproteobacteria bacterium]